MKSRNKEHKTHESIIGKIIYGFLLFMPLLAIGITCAYAIFNKNAYQSYGDKTDTTIINVQNNDIVESGTLLTITYNGGALYNNPFPFKVLNNETDILKFFPNESFVVDRFSLLQSGGRTRLLVIDNNGNTYNSFNWQNEYTTFYFVTAEQMTFTTINNADFNITYVTYINAELSEVFYYSIDKVQQSPLFNWAEDSLIYTGMTNTCNALNITTPFIPLLMTYWLIISVIYILYDIILVILHIFHKKIHQLEDSF